MKIGSNVIVDTPVLSRFFNLCVFFVSFLLHRPPFDLEISVIWRVSQFLKLFWSKEDSGDISEDVCVIESRKCGTQLEHTRKENSSNNSSVLICCFSYLK